MAVKKGRRKAKVVSTHPASGVSVSHQAGKHKAAHAAKHKARARKH